MHGKENSGIFLAALGLILSISAPCVADDIYVNIRTDTNDGFCGGSLNLPCSLRDAVLTANRYPGPDTIHVPAGHYNLTIAGKGENLAMTGDLDIEDDVRIVGSRSGTTLIDGSQIDRVFHVLQSSDPINVDFFDLTIRGGQILHDPQTDAGAGLLVVGATVVLSRCIVEGNVTTTANGGGVTVMAGGSVTIRDSTIRGNQAKGGAGVFALVSDLTIENSTVVDNFGLSDSNQAGAVYTSEASVRLTNSTFYNNHVVSTSLGIGGLTFQKGDVEINSCTVAENNGAAQIRTDPTHPAVVTLGNTIVKGSCNGQGFNSIGGNIATSVGTDCGFTDEDSPFVSIYLLPLGDYGGPTPTAPLQLISNNGNVAIDNDQAEPNCPAVDQRGIARPQDGNGDGQEVCDTGAVEVVFAGNLIFGDSFEAQN